MFDIKKQEIQWGGKTLTLETGRVARQADGAVMATLGETVVLCAVTAARSVKDGQDFFPLTVHYQEKYQRGRPHPRRLLQARARRHREGDADQPPDRSPDPPAVPGRLLQRDQRDLPGSEL